MESNNTTRASSDRLRLRDGILQHYPDVLTPEAIDALEALAGFSRNRRQIMHARIARRDARFKDGRWIAFLDSTAVIVDTGITVQQARAGRFDGSDIPPRSSVPVDPGYGSGHQAAVNSGGGDSQCRLCPQRAYPSHCRKRFCGEERLGQWMDGDAFKVDFLQYH